MALSLYVFHFFNKFKVLLLVTLCLMVLWAAFSYFVDSGQTIPKLKSVGERFGKMISLEEEEDSQKEEKMKLTEEVPATKPPQGPCPALSPYLRGASKLTFSPSLTLEEVQKENPQVAEGRYRPAECSALQRVAILIPHRNRERHLLYLLEHLHPFLQRQQLEYGIYVIHQVGQLCRGWRGCLHYYLSVLLLVGRNNCGRALRYQGYFGGVTALTRDQFSKVNGFSNNYWGWGGEDDDLRIRVEMQKMRVMRPSADVARYTMIFHNRDHGNEENRERMKLLRQVSRTWKTDGLNSCSYRLLSVEHNPLYINITVDFSIRT
uniref:Beta-1,4-galactosyltransferase n=1 Tax=Pavo cristatus TaxID=9049 RepID=A0A8C9FG25_PAVCR